MPSTQCWACRAQGIRQVCWRERFCLGSLEATHWDTRRQPEMTTVMSGMKGSKEEPTTGIHTCCSKHVTLKYACNTHVDTKAIALQLLSEHIVSDYYINHVANKRTNKHISTSIHGPFQRQALSLAGPLAERLGRGPPDLQPSSSPRQISTQINRYEFINGDSCRCFPVLSSRKSRLWFCVCARLHI